MKKFLNIFFVILGIIFFIQIIVLAYLWFADPFGVRPFIDMLTADTPAAMESVTSTSGVVDKNPALSSQQEAALESIGVNPANLPTTITPEMETCFAKKLGTTRVAEIKAGDTPTAAEVFTTRECYQ